MHAALLVVEMLAIIAALLAVVGATMYGFCWALLCLVRFFPIIGRRHRHRHWEDLTKHSGRSGRAEDLLH
jgi:hypothetical protein